MDQIHLTPDWLIGWCLCIFYCMSQSKRKKKNFKGILKRKTDNLLTPSCFQAVLLSPLVQRQLVHFLFFLREATLKQFIHSFESRNGASLPASLDQSAFIFPGDFMPGGRQNCIVKARFTGSQYKSWWCHHPIAIILCNQHLLHNDT